MRSFDRGKVFRLFYRIRNHLQLVSVNIMVYIFTGKFHHLAFTDKVEIPDTGHFPVIIFQPEHRISILIITEHDVLHVPCNRLHCTFPFLFFTAAIRLLPPSGPVQTEEQGCAFPVHIPAACCTDGEPYRLILFSSTHKFYELPRADRHDFHGIFRRHRIDTGLFFDQFFQSAEQSPASCQYDPPVQDVRG